MSIYEKEIEGREFDWFAVDCEGHIGLFSTAGEGCIPEFVIKNYADHDNISKLLESPNWGSSKVWSDYAGLGFYVYDWNLSGSSYKKECEPVSTMNTELKSKILAMNSLVRLPVRFMKLKEITDI